MSQPQRATPSSAICDSPRTDSAHGNRLVIAHLLLWMTTTGLVWTYLIAHRPLPPEAIETSTTTTQPGVEAEIEWNEGELRNWRQQETQLTVAMAFAPVYGAALAGAVLSAWRIATRRFGFPVQPGHWLLVAIAIKNLLA